MKIHEYQAKELLKDYGIPIQDGVTIEDVAQAEAGVEQVHKELGAAKYVIKAQVHAGGRGKGGGVKFSPDRESALEHIQNILGMTLVTHQTGAEGRLVKKVMVAEALDIQQEFYAAITLDRSRGMDVFMVSSEGGMEIEEVARTSPEKIVKEVVAETNVNATVQKLTNMMEIAGYGVMNTPAVVLDGKVISSGKVPNKDDVKSWLEK